MTRRVTSPVFVGRAAELERVARLRVEVQSSNTGATLLVTGEAGIGKTRFAAEIARRAASDGWVVLAGECDEFSAESRPFAALQGMVATIERVLAGDLPGELESPAWRVVASLGQSEPGAKVTGSIASAASHLLRAIAGRHPVLLMIDDLHWADESTRLLFASLARGLNDVPVLVAGAYRDNEVHRQHPLVPILAAVERTSRPEHVALHAFTFEEATQVAEAVSAPLGRLPYLFERSGGNAFLLEEVLATAERELPPGLSQVVLARLDALGADAVELAEVASLDSTMPLPVLATAADLGATRSDAAVDLLVERGILRLEANVATFRHALIREVIYDRITPAKRMALHRRAAEAFEQFDARRVGEAARHWQLTGDTREALRASVAAGTAAARVGALPEAADLFEYALQAWPNVTDPETVARISRTSLVATASHALVRTRRFTRAAGLLEVELTDRSLPAVERSALLIQLSMAYICLPPMDRALEAAREAVDCPADEAAPLQQLYPIVFFIEYACNMFDRAAEARCMLDRAEAMFYGDERPLPLAGLEFIRAAVATVYGEESARPKLNETSRLAADIPGSTLHFASYRAMLGDHEWMMTKGLEERDWLFDLGWGLVEGSFAEAEIAVSRSRLGRWQECHESWEQLLRRCGYEALFEDTPDLLIYGWALTFVRTGREDEARTILRAAWEWAVPVITHYSMVLSTVRVELARLDDDVAESREAVNHLLDRINGHFLAMSGEAVALAIAFEADEAFRHRGPADEALALADRWIAKLESCLMDAPGRVNLADFGVYLDVCRAERARLAGADDPGRWERLADTWDALPRPYDAARARFRAAWALLLGDAPAPHEDRQRAASHLSSARTTAAELGAVHFARDIEALWRTAGLREERAAVSGTATALAKPATGAPPLTAREVQVLALLARGESNGRIAIALDISARTAAVHVSNIIHKLGAKNRVEAAMRARNLGVI